MIERLKRALRESYIGAIALGWVLAQAIMQFVNALASPLALRLIGQRGTSLELVLPGLVQVLLVLVIWYWLVRWLYFRPSGANTASSKITPARS